MALSIACPGCDADYSVPENLVGKTIRCKACGESILVKAVKAKAAARPVRDEDDEDDDRPRAKARPAAARSRRDEDDEDDVAPKKSNLPMILFGLAALLIAGGVGGYFALAGGKDDSKPVAANLDRGGMDRGGRETPRPDVVVPGTDAAAKADDTKKDDSKREDVKKDDTKKDDTAKADDTKKDDTTAKADDKKTEPVAKVDTAKADTAKAADKTVKPVDKANQISDRAVAGVVSGTSGMSYQEYLTGVMPPNVLAMVKKASVYIEVESGNSGGSGSGWFGIEPGLVFTNAHVLDMKAPNAPPPKKITFTLNSGTPEQRVIPHSKIKILAVDREIDIAVLQVLNEPDLPPPLKVRPSSECMEGLAISTVGYPFGGAPTGISGHGTHKPEVSIRRTTITAFRRNDFGVLRRVQFEGAANPGNSGGPLVDAEGTVCTVVVEGVHTGRSVVQGIALSMGVPTEYCFGILAGRIENINTQIAYKDGDKVRIPIKITTLDPLKRLKSIGVAGWIGNPSDKYRSPGLTKPASVAGDRDYVETTLTYDAEKKVATGEIILPKKPDGTVYWIQPYYSNPIVTRYWEPGTVYERSGDAADRENANLMVKLETGKIRNVTMSTAALRPNDGEDAEGEGESISSRRLFKFGLNVKETVRPAGNADSVAIAKLQLEFKDLLKPKALEHGGEGQDILRGSDFEAINNEVKKCGGQALVNKEGRVYKSALNLANVSNNPQIHYFVDWFTRSATQSLEATSIPLPNREVKPDETWNNTDEARTIEIQDPAPRDRQGRPIPNAKLPPLRVYRYNEKMTMKYVGTRERQGKKEAMVLIEGKIVTAPGTSHTATGEIKGFAMVELDTGAVIESHIDKHFEVDTSEKGVKKSFVQVFKYDIKRSSSTN